MLGKRGTTSTSGITARLAEVAPPNLPSPEMVGAGLSSYVSSYNYGFVDHSADFLKRCGLCNRRLSQGRDIYMYMGDAAYCSVECREQRMKEDEGKKTCAATAKK